MRPVMRTRRILADEFQECYLFSDKMKKDSLIRTGVFPFLKREIIHTSLSGLPRLPRNCPYVTGTRLTSGQPASRSVNPSFKPPAKGLVANETWWYGGMADVRTGHRFFLMSHPRRRNTQMPEEAVRTEDASFIFHRA